VSVLFNRLQLLFSLQLWRVSYQMRGSMHLADITALGCYLYVKHVFLPFTVFEGRCIVTIA
jgi:hypothetical protein